MENENGHRPRRPAPNIVGRIPSNNVGRGGGWIEEPTAGTTAKPNGSEASQPTIGRLPAKCESTEPNKQSHHPPPEWLAYLGNDRMEATRKANTEAAETGKAIGLILDRQTQAILSQENDRTLKPETAEAYRRDYDRLRGRGVSPLDAASTRAHYDRLRTACRYCLAEDVRALRAQSEAARRAGDMERAKAATAWQAALVLRGWFQAPSRPTWAQKAAGLRDGGVRATRKTKRDATPRGVAASWPVLALVASPPGANRRGDKLAERHAERLAVLALTGARPAELQLGIRITAATTPKGRPALSVEIEGAKIGGARGIERRRMVFDAADGPAAGLWEGAAARGGRWTMGTSKADHRSLNRALMPLGLSAYSYRHAIGGRLKDAITAGTMTPTQAAEVMGHRSTASLMTYGHRGRGGKAPARLPAAVGTSGEAIRVAAVSRTERATVRAARGDGVDWERFRFPAPPQRPEAGSSPHPPPARPAPAMRPR